MRADFSKIQIPYLRDQEIRQKADELRSRTWGDILPVDVELIAERDLNLFLIPIPDLRRMADADAYLSGDLKEIAYDPAVPDVRIRFSVAHEVGHFILHADIIRKLAASSQQEWRDIQGELPEALWGRAEYQAREFAGRLLVPSQLLMNEIRKLQPSIAEAMKIAPDLEAQVIKDLISPKLARRFFVSAEVILRRTEAEKISPVQ